MASVEVLVPVESLEEASKVRRLAKENPALRVYCTVRARCDFRCIQEDQLFVAMGFDEEREPCRRCFGGPEQIYEPQERVPLQHLLTGEGCPWHRSHDSHAGYGDVFDDLDCEPGILPAGSAQALPLLLEEIEHVRGEKDEYYVPFELLQIKGTPLLELVWQELRTTPRGETISSSDLIDRVAARRGSRTSVGSISRALGENPLRILVPCHRGLRDGQNPFGSSLDGRWRKELLQGEAEGFTWVELDDQPAFSATLGASLQQMPVYSGPYYGDDVPF